MTNELIEINLNYCVDYNLLYSKYYVLLRLFYNYNNSISYLIKILKTECNYNFQII